jgi:LuxR family transcriptional regulator, regulator of acetate metabolism
VPAASSWRPRGVPIRSRALVARVREVADRAAAHLGEPVDVPCEVPAGLDALDALTARLRAVPTVPVDELLEVRDLHGALREAIVTHLDFDRAFISRVDGTDWVPGKFFVKGDPAWAAELEKVASGQRQPLDQLVLESDMVRRRAPLLVHDVQGRQDMHQAIAEVSRSESYVAAPIMPEGRVIGFLHADLHLQRRHVDELDRDVLFAFATALGYVVERTVLLTRLRRQGDQVRAMSASLEAVIEEIRESEIDLAADEEHAPGSLPYRAPRAADHHALASLLTARELEVMRLMASGASNAAIANELVVSEGTVKSHVKHILRKMRAANRAEAASKYMRIVAARGGDDPRQAR